MRRTVFLILPFLQAGLPAQDPPAAGVDVRRILTGISTKFRGATAYSFEADLQVDGQRGDVPGRLLSQAKVKLAAAPGGKSYLHMAPVDKDEYMLISDGQKTWAYVPALKQYTETEGAAVDKGGSEMGSTKERDLAESFSQLVMPALGEILQSVEAASAAEPVEVRYEGKKYTWPVIRVLSKKSEDGQTLTEVAVDPETLRIGRVVSAHLSYKGAERMVVRMTAHIRSLKVGEPPPDSTFAFEPPKKAKLVDAVPIPGQTGSFLLNRQAPEFEAKTLDGERVRLGELRNRTVVLNFWASWCGPCRRELPVLARLHEELKDKGLVVLGVNDEGKGTAKEYAETTGLRFATLDDSKLQLHRLYRVNSVPSTFIIDREGKVVRFLRGVHSEQDIRAALKSAGL